MAGSRFEYVRRYEDHAKCLLNTFIVLRVDGRGFSKFTGKNKYHKPNDENGLRLMNAAAENVMKSFPDIFLAYGQSDEYSFVFNRKTTLFQRRREKILSSVVSLFSSTFVGLWNKFHTSEMIEYPHFDGRIVLYPTLAEVRDYFSWRQADCHINNLFNTTFWALVLEGGMSTQEAKAALDGSTSSLKNEILFSRFNRNYNKEPAIFRKGSVIWNRPPLITHIDIIKNDEFWKERYSLS